MSSYVSWCNRCGGTGKIGPQHFEYPPSKDHNPFEDKRPTCPNCDGTGKVRVTVESVPADTDIPTPEYDTSAWV